MITANGCCRGWVTGNAPALYLGFALRCLFSDLESRQLARHISGVQNFFQIDLLMSADSLSRSAQKTKPWLVKVDDDCRDGDNGGFADDEVGGRDEGSRCDKSNDSASGESGGNDNERGQKSPGVSALEGRLSS